MCWSGVWTCPPTPAGTRRWAGDLNAGTRPLQARHRRAVVQHLALEPGRARCKPVQARPTRPTHSDALGGQASHSSQAIAITPPLVGQPCPATVICRLPLSASSDSPRRCPSLARKADESSPPGLSQSPNPSRSRYRWRIGCPTATHPATYLFTSRRNQANYNTVHSPFLPIPRSPGGDLGREPTPPDN